MSLIAQALVTAAEAEGYCQLQNPDHDVVVEMIINSVSQQFSTFASRQFMTAVYTALKLTGNGTAYLYLPNWPVTTLTSVAEDTATLTVDTDFYADLTEGLLTKASFYGTLYGEMYGYSASPWSINTHGIVVTYTAGYTAALLPWDLKMAALKEIARQYQIYLTKSNGVSSASVQGSSVSAATPDKPEWMEVVSRYRRIRI
jgi:hypothetical protein